MVFNVNANDTLAKSLETLGNTKIIQSLSTLALCSLSSSLFVYNQIASSVTKFEELRKVLTDQSVRLHTSGKYMDAFIRFRLLYNAATWYLDEITMGRMSASSQITWATCGRPSLGLPFRQYISIFLSIYLSTGRPS